MKLSSWKENTAAAKEGVVRNFDPDGKCYIRVARANNERFEKELRRLMAPYKGFRRSNVPDKTLDEMACRAMAKCILLEMVGFEDDHGDIAGTKGAVIEDTEENRFKVLIHPAYKDFRELVSNIASDHANYLLESEEADLGKSLPTSAGGGRGEST